MVRIARKLTTDKRTKSRISVFERMEICKECSRLDERISQAGKDVLVQGCAITDYILFKIWTISNIRN